MRRAPALVVTLLVGLLSDAVIAQTKQDCLITINTDGTCDAAGLHVLCRDIGPELRKAGIPADAPIRFGLDRTVDYGVVSVAIQSVTHAGFTNSKVGFITAEPER